MSTDRVPTQSEIFTRNILEEALEKTIQSAKRLETKLGATQALVKNLKAAIAAE